MGSQSGTEAALQVQTIYCPRTLSKCPKTCFTPSKDVIPNVRRHSFQFQKPASLILPLPASSFQGHQPLSPNPIGPSLQFLPKCHETLHYKVTGAPPDLPPSTAPSSKGNQPLSPTLILAGFLCNRLELLTLPGIRRTGSSSCAVSGPCQKDGLFDNGGVHAPWVTPHVLGEDGRFPLTSVCSRPGPRALLSVDLCALTVTSTSPLLTDFARLPSHTHIIL